MSTLMNYTYQSFNFRGRKEIRPFYDVIASIADEEYGHMQKASSDAVKQLAQAEVDEQTGLSAKLTEIATAKGVSLPMSPDAATQAMVAQMQGASGGLFDKQYVQKSGVEGHQKLDQVMSSVESSAGDESLKDLAKAVHPLVKTHPKVSQAMLGSM